MNVTVRNGDIRGFRNGVSSTDGLYRVENNRFDNNMQTATCRPPSTCPATAP